jgi:predicted permease
MNEELGFHVEQQTAANIAAGMRPEEARRRAVLDLGAVEGVKEGCREERRGSWLETLWADVRFGLRMLRKSPGFTAVAVLTLALGVGANTAIFSILDPLLLRKLPVPNPDELVWVNSVGTRGPAEISDVGTFRIYRDKATVFSSVLAFSRVAPYEVTHKARTISANGELVSGNYFETLGVRPLEGRFFRNIDEHGPPRVVLGFDFWKREFDSDPGAIGRAFSFGGDAYTVLGVAPPEFFGAEVGESPDFYLPLDITSLPGEVRGQAEWVTILARLKPGVSMAQAQAALLPLLEQSNKGSNIPEIELREGFARVVLTPAARGLSEERAKFSLPARVLMAVVGLVLFIACGNVANLLLARGMTRQREFTVRLALGAGRWRVIRQLLTESTLLAAAGALAGMALGRWASGLLVASLSTRRLPVVLLTGWGSRTLLFTAVALALTVLLCGLAPALSATRGELAEGLKAQGSGSHRSSTESRLGKILIVAQVALSMMLLMVAGLLLRSLWKLETFDAGFDRDNVLVVTTNGFAASETRVEMAVFYNRLLERVKQLPGVRSACYSSFTPISGKEVGVNVTVEGYTLRPGEVANEQFTGVSPGYFETMGIPLLEGREFTEADVHEDSNSPQSTTVAIINRTMARRFFGDTSPLGKHFRFVEGNRPLQEIVGVVADSKYNDLREMPIDFFYIPGTHGELEIRASGFTKSLVGLLREILHSLDSSVTITSIETLRERVDESLHSDRLIAGLCGAFSLLALALASIGLYGMLAFSVARRTSEIGIRMALGARPRDIFRLIAKQGIALTLLGLGLGAAGAVASTSLLASLLFGVHRGDPLASVAVCVLLLLAALLACLVPARRAMRVDPVIALRCE